MATPAKRQRVPTEDCMRLRKTFARNIRGWADARGISLNHLADRSGVSRAQMYNVLSGSSSPSLDWITKIAPVLGVQVWELLVASVEPERAQAAVMHQPIPVPAVHTQPDMVPLHAPISHMPVHSALAPPIAYSGYAAPVE